MDGVISILDAFLDIPRVSLQLLRQLPDSDPLSVGDGPKRINLSVKWPRNPLWRCIDHIFWSARRLWEFYWRSELPVAVAKFIASISSIASSFGSSSAKGAVPAFLKLPKKGKTLRSIKEAAKHHRHGFAQAMLDRLIETMQFPGLLPDTAEGAYTAIYDLFYHGKFLFADNFEDARKQFVDQVFENHLLPLMAMSKEVKDKIDESPTSFIFEGLHMLPAELVEDAASLALERTIMDNAESDGILFGLLQTLQAKFQDASTAAAALGALNSLAHPGIKFLSEKEAHLCASLLENYVLPLLSKQGTDLATRIRAVDCCGAVAQLLGRFGSVVVIPALPELQRIALSDTEPPSLIYLSIKNLCQLVTQRRVPASNVEVSALVEASIKLYATMKSVAVLNMIRAFLAMKIVGPDAIRLVEAVCAETEGMVRSVAANVPDFAVAESGDSALDRLVAVLEVLEELVYSELGAQTAAAVEDIISSKLLGPILDAEDLFADPQMVQPVCAVVGALTYTIPRPSPTLWRFFVPIAEAQANYPDLLEGTRAEFASESSLTVSLRFCSSPQQLY